MGYEIKAMLLSVGTDMWNEKDKTKHETRTLNAIRLGARAFCG